MTWFLGMDGGGTKTAFVLLDGAGDVVARSTQPSCYYFGAPGGLAAVERIVADGVRAVTDGVTDPGSVEFSFFAFPGYGEVSGDVAALDALPARVLGHDRYACGNDMVSGWAGALGARDGVNVVAGTGSIAYGERAGRTRRTGGWGELFGDEGSAHWVAVEGLRAFSRMADGRVPRTPLHDAVLAAVGVRHPHDVVGVVLDGWGARRADVARLAPVVTGAAAEGDATAGAIVRAAATELADLVESTALGLGHAPGDRVTVSRTGGLFAAAVVRDAFEQALRRSRFAVDLVEPRHDPGHGSALYARTLAGRRVAP
ncbi:BadF/BadG/BcrA/BcrD ATPase family protein [Kineococcus endophyticus]|uniref:BadF/BadG/BcrA/BcrD ATPase family protein n=1 Tax=Kineococcus endophyticus TaxID=1181883 RepID=A0ABV3P9U3_9ACTN